MIIYENQIQIKISHGYWKMTINENESLNFQENDMLLCLFAGMAETNQY